MDSSLKFNETEFTVDKTVSGLPNVPSAAGMTAAQLKARFDNIGKVMIALGKHNALVDALTASTAASEIGASFGGVTMSVQDALDSLIGYVIDLRAMLADGFSPLQSYAVGDYVYYNGDLYRFTASHLGSWNTADVEVISVCSVLEDQQNDIADLQALGLSVVNNQICITY